MSPKEFLLPRESIKYTGIGEVEHQGATYNIFVTNLRLILYARKGLVFRKERIVSERLLEIKNMRYKENLALNKGVLLVETSKGKMEVVGNRDGIKAILKELQKCKKVAEANIRPSLYMEPWLVENETPARSLARMVWKKANSCCVCGDKKISLWIFNATSLGHTANRARAFAILILARLFCREHEKSWKKGEMLDYKTFNGLMILKEPYLKPLGVWVKISQSKLSNIMESLARAPSDVEIKLDLKLFFSHFLTNRSDLILKGTIDGFLQ